MLNNIHSNILVNLSFAHALLLKFSLDKFFNIFKIYCFLTLKQLKIHPWQLFPGVWFSVNINKSCRNCPWKSRVVWKSTVMVNAKYSQMHMKIQISSVDANFGWNKEAFANIKSENKTSVWKKYLFNFLEYYSLPTIAAVQWLLCIRSLFLRSWIVTVPKSWLIYTTFNYSLENFQCSIIWCLLRRYRVLIYKSLHFSIQMYAFFSEQINKQNRCLWEKKKNSYELHWKNSKDTLKQIQSQSTVCLWGAIQTKWSYKIADAAIKIF